MNEIEYWIDQEGAKEMFSSDYWNNIENEKKKKAEEENILYSVYEGE